MSLVEMHVLERGSQPLRGARRIAPLLRAEMDALGLSAKELAARLREWAAEDPSNRWPVDYRVIQHAMLGTACALDTYLAFAGFFGWDFSERVQTPIHGVDPLSAREAEVVRQQHQVAALQARVERDRALRQRAAPGLGWLARGPTPGGARAAIEDRAFAEPEAEAEAEALGPENLDLFEGARP
jgi:hypothetical protein